MIPCDQRIGCINYADGGHRLQAEDAGADED